MSCGCNLRKRITKDKILLDKTDVYLDYNATTKPNIAVLAKVDKFNRNLWGNPSAQNSRGVNLYNYIIEEINITKKYLKCLDSTIFFDSSSSSIIKKLSKVLIKKEIVSTNIEHKSLLECSNIKIDVDKQGLMKINELKKCLENPNIKPILIFSPVNHETGTIQNLKEIYKFAKEYKTDIIFDAVQTISRININKWLPYCDGFYFSGHKIYGLQGSASLILKKNFINFKLEDSPLPFSLFTGTFNTPSVIALLEATNILIKNFQSELNELTVLHKEALYIISKLEFLYYLESSEDGAPGIINISFPKLDKIEDLLFYLNSENIQLSRLSACTGDINKESYVLIAMGRDKLRSRNSLRISFGNGSKRDDFFKLTASIKRFLTSISY